MNTLPNWLQSNYSHLSDQYSNGKLPHGLLIVGYSGNGASLFLSKLVNRLLCLTPGNEACGTCKSCELSKSGHHPDYMKVEPEGKSLTIKVDSIRAITKKTSETAQQGGNKVIHIEAAQKMNVNAANALLKVLEEPTDNTFILLESDQLSQTLPTVRSRCRIVQLKQPSTEQALEYLKTKEMTVNEQAALSIASARPLDALQVDQETIDKWYAREEKFLSNHQFTELSQYIAKENIEEVLSQVLLWLDSVLRYKLNAKLELAPVSEGLLKSLANCENVPLFHLRDYIVEKLAGQKRQSNLNNQLMAEELTSRWLKLRGQQ